MTRRNQEVVCALMPCCLLALIFVTGCCRKQAEPPPDNPRLIDSVAMRDVTFHSAALDRDMKYRVVLPTKISANQKLPVIYLLHGGGGNFRDWTNYSDVAKFAEHGLVLVMPQGDSSYYVNSAIKREDRYEDYIVNDLGSDVAARFPVAAERSKHAIIGISMGGFGAVKIALSHPELFAFAGGISSAIDVPRRPFSIKRVMQWEHHRSIFGAWNSETRKANDPLTLVRQADPMRAPFFYLTCGEQEGLLPANRQFAALLNKQHLAFQFGTAPAVDTTGISGTADCRKYFRACWNTSRSKLHRLSKSIR